MGYEHFLGNQYLVKETFFLAETFRAFYSRVDLSVGKILGGNTIVFSVSLKLTLYEL